MLVVTDRRILDRQIQETVKNFTQVRSAVKHAEHSSDLKTAIQEGKRIIITTVEKFPYIVGEIGSRHRSRSFAIIIDEAHSSQGGKYSVDTMYIDKEISGVKAVQTLSRLNRTYPGKSETFMLDFANDAGITTDSFSRYYKTAILSGETDPCCNALKNSDEQGARIEVENVLRRAVSVVSADSTELYGQYQSNDNFRKWLIDIMVKAVNANRIINKKMRR